MRDGGTSELQSWFCGWVPLREALSERLLNRLRRLGSAGTALRRRISHTPKRGI